MKFSAIQLIVTTAAVTGFFAAPGYAQTVPANNTQVAVISPLPAKPPAAAEDDAIRPFHINVPEAELVDLRRRLVATRWPDKESVTDKSQGVQLETMKELVRYCRRITTGARSRRS